MFKVNSPAWGAISGIWGLGDRAPGEEAEGVVGWVAAVRVRVREDVAMGGSSSVSGTIGLPLLLLRAVFECFTTMHAAHSTQ